MSNELLNAHIMLGEPCGEDAGLYEIADWAGYLIMRDMPSIPLQPTPSMIEAGAQRLMSWDDESVWPDSWAPLQIMAARNDAERIWRSMWLAAQDERQKVDTSPHLP